MPQMVSNVVVRYVDALSAPQISVGVGWSTAVTRGGRATPLLMTKADHMATSADQMVKVPLLTSKFELSEVRSLEKRT